MSQRCWIEMSCGGYSRAEILLKCKIIWTQTRPHCMPFSSLQCFFFSLMCIQVYMYVYKKNTSMHVCQHQIRRCLQPLICCQCDMMSWSVQRSPRELWEKLRKGPGLLRWLIIAKASENVMALEDLLYFHQSLQCSQPDNLHVKALICFHVWENKVIIRSCKWEQTIAKKMQLKKYVCTRVYVRACKPTSWDACV